MDNQHKKISGYRDLSQAEIDLMNSLKSLGNEFDVTYAEAGDVALTKLKEEVCGKVESYIAALTIAGLDAEELAELTSYESMVAANFHHAGHAERHTTVLHDARVTRRYVQQAMMWAIRCVARPTTFC